MRSVVSRLARLERAHAYFAGLLPPLGSSTALARKCKHLARAAFQGPPDHQHLAAGIHAFQ